MTQYLVLLPSPEARYQTATDQEKQDLFDEALGQLRGRAGIGDAQGTRFAEGRARHAGDALGFEQRIAEVHIAADGMLAVPLSERAADVREDIERALRLRADQAWN